MSSETETAKSSSGTVSPGAFYLLLALVIACGAAVMEVEVLGARIIGPYFGVGLFVWTALISVTLLSLAFGYYLGGRVADRSASLAVLCGIVASAAIWLLLVPAIRVPVLKASSHMGIRMGALFASTVLFAPCLALLGTVGPFAIRLILRDLAKVGRTAGWVSAMSTLGSLAGTVGTGFYLAPLFHVDQIAVGTAIALLALAGLGLFLGRGWTLALLLPLPGLLLLAPPPLATTIMPSGTKAEVVHRRGSYYGEIKVVEYSFPPRRTREMVVGGVAQGAVDVQSGEPLSPYTYALEMALFKHNPSARKVLAIGLGPGTVPSRLGRCGYHGTVVEIDPAVREVASAWFGFSEGTFRTVIGDGRIFLGNTEEMFDAIVLDAFNGDTEPSHLLTAEAFQSAVERLNPGGVLAINVSGLSPGPGVANRAIDAIMRASRSAFSATVAYPLPCPPGAVTNFTIVAEKSGSMPPKARSQMPLPIHPSAARRLVGFMEKPYEPAPGSEYYSDGWAPMDAHNAQAKLLWRKQVLTDTPLEVLLD